jgi:hypothetical protein
MVTCVLHVSQFSIDLESETQIPTSMMNPDWHVEHVTNEAQLVQLFKLQSVH